MPGGLTELNRLKNYTQNICSKRIYTIIGENRSCKAKLSDIAIRTAAWKDAHLTCHSHYEENGGEDK